MDRPVDVLGYYTSRHALPSEYVLPALGVLALVVFCGWYFSKPQKLKRELRRAPRFKITDLPDSTLGRVVGVARPIGEPLTSPLNGRPCLYFISTVSTVGRGARVVAREERGVPFLLEDDTGRAIVDPQGADVALDQDEHSSSGTLDNPTEVEARFLARHGEVSKGLVFNRALADAV
ncbi:MAG: GIDE domain-containing protein, partial [Proteobacteria bacterium]|nr:GIDE domain-containing protein [Pseudomonadota bacterium]